MANPWKLSTIGMALVVTTALITGLTTAYLVRPSADATPLIATDEPTSPARVVAPAPLSASASRSAARPAAASPATRVAAPVPSAPSVTPVPTQRVPSPPVATVPADCATGGDRAWRIAKPGLIGAVLGAGVGAAGGAIADGGQGAGKGALIGGLVGAVTGSGYGAYRTKQECGAIVGGPDAPTAAAAAAPSVTPNDRGGTPQAALHASSADDRIAIFHAR